MVRCSALIFTVKQGITFHQSTQHVFAVPIDTIGVYCVCMQIVEHLYFNFQYWLWLFHGKLENAKLPNIC